MQTELVWFGEDVIPINAHTYILHMLIHGQTLVNSKHTDKTNKHRKTHKRWNVQFTYTCTIHASAYQLDLALHVHVHVIAARSFYKRANELVSMSEREREREGGREGETCFVFLRCLLELPRFTVLQLPQEEGDVSPPPSPPQEGLSTAKAADEPEDG